MATPTGQTGSVGSDSKYTTDSQILRRIADIRRHRGLPDDRESDRIWLRRIKSGGASIGDARTRIEQKAVELSRAPEVRRPAPPPPSDPTPTPDPDIEQDPVDEDTPDPLDPEDFAPHWMEGELLDIFTDKWAETDDTRLAMEAVRKSNAYDKVFVGNRREDGSLRYKEQQYFSQREGFREAATEFGVGGLDDQQIKGLFENDVDAREFFQGVGQAHERFTEPGADTHRSLLDAYVDAFTKTGSAVEALEQVRGTDEYDRVFAGNQREDGSLRMQEQEYFAYKRGWQRALLQHGLDPSLFEGKGRFVQSVEAEQSIRELEGRLQATQEGILGNIEQVKQFYAENYGLDMTDEAILGAAIDPEVGTDLLQRRITAGQVGGEARLQGFARSVERAEELARAGLDQQQARQLFTEAASRVPVLDTLARRHNDPTGEFGVRGFEDAAFLGDAETRRRMERRLRDEESTFTTRQGVRRDRETGGLTGLRQR